MTDAPVEIIIPTMDNRPYLEPCLRSLWRWRGDVAFHVTVINNGAAGSCDWLDNQNCTVLQPGKNLGWTGALQLGLDHTVSPYVCFLNDDTLFVPSSPDWLDELVAHVSNPRCGAAGPSSNCVSGAQRIDWIDGPPVHLARYLIGFCMTVRRAALDAAGGVDPTLPGGDDLDLSIRLQDHGYTLVCDRRVFVYHHGFRTGDRVHGPAGVPFGWNSPQYSRMVADALVAKHGKERVERIGWPV